MTPAPIGIQVADNDALVRQVVRAAIDPADRFRVVGETSDEADTVAFALEHRPAIVLLEVRICPGREEEVIRRLCAPEDAPRVLVFSTSSDPGLIVGALRAGACSFVGKHEGPGALVPALQAVMAGQVLMPGTAAMQLLELVRQAPDEGAGLRPVVSEFTAREWEILDLMSVGESTQAIAEALVLSPHTVYSHIKNIFRKLGVHTRGDAVREARAVIDAARNGSAPRPSERPLNGARSARVRG